MTHHSPVGAYASLTLGAIGKGVSIHHRIGSAVTIAEFLQVAGIIRLHLTVADVGHLIGAASLIVLDRTYDAGLIAHHEDIQTTTA